MISQWWENREQTCLWILLWWNRTAGLVRHQLTGQGNNGVLLSSWHSSFLESYKDDALTKKSLFQTQPTFHAWGGSAKPLCWPEPVLSIVCTIDTTAGTCTEGEKLCLDNDIWQSGTAFVSCLRVMWNYFSQPRQILWFFFACQRN